MSWYSSSVTARCLAMMRLLHTIKIFRHYHSHTNTIYTDASKSICHMKRSARVSLWSLDIQFYSTHNDAPKITSEEYERFHTKGLLRELNSRKYVNSNLADFTDKKVSLLGWVERSSDDTNIFIVDGYGKTLCSISTKSPKLQDALNKLKNSDIVSANGTVYSNPKTNRVSAVLDSISLMTSDEGGVSENDTNERSTFTFRTHTCGELRHVHLGQQVSLCGWLQYQRMSKFLLLRDAHGMVQCVLPNKVDAKNIPLESVLKVTGTVCARSQNTVNPTMATGDIEVVVDHFDVLNVVKDIPFTLKNQQKPKEQLRLQHRYLDLRYPQMQNNLRLRSQVLHSMRRFLIERHSFVEVETPTLFCRTPGGAREFVVPTRHRGLFYSLVQSPQQFKQMLMVGGVDRYFQVARCYRDESTRPDRQPEFTQLDIELSFTTVDGVLKLIEELLYLTYPIPMSKPPFHRLTYRQALETYGSDKPNMAYELKLNNVTSCIENVHSINDFGAYALVLPKELEKSSNKTKEAMRVLKKRYPQTHIVDYHKLPEGVTKQIWSKLKLDESKTLFIAAGFNDDTCRYLGEMRVLFAETLCSKGLLDVKRSVCEPCWILDFPLFAAGANGELETCHHPFTAPHPDDVHLLESEPLKVRSLAYDLVVNGNEVGGGSVRVHDADFQVKLLKMLRIDPGTMEHFIAALRCGCPPHAGIALGIDRMMAQACDAESIRDVIAFPKSHEGNDPLSSAPNRISDDDKDYYHIDIKDAVDRTELRA